MPIAPINRAKTIAVPLSAASGENIVTVYENSGLTIGSEVTPGYTVVSHNCFIKNLKAFSQINSLPEIALPNFELTDSETTKLYKTLNVEWQSARKQLNLFIGIGNNWSQVGSTSILNPSGYPSRVYSLLDLFTDNLYFELGENGKIGVQVQDVGHGLLSGNDSIVIHGSYVEEIFVESQEPPITINVSIPSTTPTTPFIPPIKVDENMLNWIISTGNYSAFLNDKIVIDARNAATDPIIMPYQTAVTPGSNIRIIVIGTQAASLQFNGANYKGVETYIRNLSSMVETELIFIYHGVDVGWTGNLPAAIF